MAELARAGIGEDGLLVAVRIDPRAMRFCSAELAEHVVKAVRAQREHEPPLLAALGVDADTLVRRLDGLQVQEEVRDFDHVAAMLDDTLRRITE